MSSSTSSFRRDRLAKRALLISLTLGGLLLVTIAAINVVVDPYAVFGLVKQATINGNRLELHSRHSELRKELGVIEHKPDYLVLGSSVVDNGFRLPGTVAFSYEEKGPFKQSERDMEAQLPDAAQFYPKLYNAGVRGGGVSEAYRMLLHAYANNPYMKRVIAGFEYNLFTFHLQYDQAPATDAINRTYVPMSVAGSLLFSYGVLDDSISTFERNSGYRPKTMREWFEKRLSKLKAKWAKWHMKDAPAAPAVAVVPSTFAVGDFHATNGYWGTDGGMIRPQDPRESPWLYFTLHTMDSFARTYATAPDAMLTDYSVRDLRAMKEFCDAHGIEFQLFINPHPALYWAGARAYGVEPYVDKWLRTLAAITPFYAFTETVDYGEKTHEYFGDDLLHYRPDIGMLIFPTLWYHRTAAESHYELVTKDTVEDYIALRKRLLDAWLEKNPYYRDIFSRRLMFRDAYPTFESIAPRAYEPVKNGLRVVEFMDGFYALPADKAPYDALKVLNGDYAPFYHADTLPALVAAMNAGLPK